MKKIISLLVGISSVTTFLTPCVSAEEGLPQIDSAISGEYEIREKQVIPQIGAKFSDLNVWGNAQLRVFKDETKEIQLTAEDALSNGNYIELEENGVFDYYTVYSNIRQVLFTANNASEMGSIARGNVIDVNGIGGKDEDDTSILLTATAAESKTPNIYSGFKDYEIGKITDGVWSYENADGYLVFEASIMPVGSTSFKLCMNQNTNFFGSAATIQVNADMWNKIVVIYDFENKLAKKIVNGEESEWIAPLFGTGSYNVLRVLIEGEPNKTMAYLDDYKIYISDDVPQYKALPSLDASVYNLMDSIFVTDQTLTAGDVVCENAVVKVFRDKTYAQMLAEDEYLESGDIIVLTTSEGDVKYYTVSTEDEVELLLWWHLDNEAVTKNTTTIVPTKNVGGGKSADDSALKYTGETYIRLNTDYNMNSAYILKTPMDDMTQYTGYMIVSMNVMSPDNTQKLSVTTNGGNIIMGNNAGGAINVKPDNGFVADRWNNVVCLIRLDNGSTTSLQTTYVNGVQISENTHKLFSSGKTEVRLNATGSGEIYYDDVKVKFTTEEPDMDSLIAMPVVDNISDKAFVDGTSYVTTADVTVGELSAQKAEIRVFENDTFETELEEDAVLCSGNVIVVKNVMGKIGYYVVD